MDVLRQRVAWIDDRLINSFWGNRAGVRSLGRRAATVSPIRPWGASLRSPPPRTAMLLAASSEPQILQHRRGDCKSELRGIGRTSLLVPAGSPYCKRRQSARRQSTSRRTPEQGRRGQIGGIADDGGMPRSLKTYDHRLRELVRRTGGLCLTCGWLRHQRDGHRWADPPPAGTSSRRARRRRGGAPGRRARARPRAAGRGWPRRSRRLSKTRRSQRAAALWRSAPRATCSRETPVLGPVRRSLPLDRRRGAAKDAGASCPGRKGEGAAVCTRWYAIRCRTARFAYAFAQSASAKALLLSKRISRIRRGS